MKVKKKMINANPVQQKVLAGAVKLLSGAPEIENGDVLWEWSR